MKSLDINHPKSETKTNHLVTFAKMNKYFLFPFLCPVFCMISTYFNEKILTSKVKIKDYFVLVYADLTYAAGGLLYFISYYKQKRNKANDSYSNRIKLLKSFNNKQETKKNPVKKWLLIVLISILILIYTIFTALYMDKHLFEKRLYFVLFIPLFSKIILKEEIYKHQYLSLIISLIGIILFIIPVSLVFEQDDIIPNILNFIGGVSISLFFVLVKYVNLTFYMSPLLICLSSGIIMVIITLLGFFIFSLIDYHDLSYFKDSLDFSEEANIASMIIIIIVNFICFSTLNVFTFLTLFYFSPILVMVTDIISPMLFWIAKTIENGPIMPDVIIYPIGYIITLISCLIYNEMIILNFYGLNKNTKKFVEKRQSEEAIELSHAHDEIVLEDLKKDSEEDDL